jgi:restriction system protein
MRKREADALILIFIVFPIWLLGAIVKLFVEGGRRRKREKHVTALLALLPAKVDQSAAVLVERHAVLAAPNRYGMVDLKKWRKEVATFMASLPPEFGAIPEEQAFEAVHARVLGLAKRTDLQPRFLETTSAAFLDPAEFERMVATTLSQRKWNARTVGGKGDQGADVLADKAGIRVVIQCKLYSGTVGNGAVQEVIAARLHYKTDIAAVVTNSEFTPSAVELARSGHVLLLHYTKLVEIDRLARDIWRSRKAAQGAAPPASDAA